MAINFNIENNNINGKTFALLRTNPKLTSNVKLVVDSAGDIFLGSFKGNKTLSQARYQRYGLSDNGKYSNDVARFYKELSSSDKYSVLRQFSDLTTYSDYEYQYEDQYNFGASFNATKLYDEQYKILAPIWLDRKVPGKFIVYRVNSVDYENEYSETVEGQNSRILELLNKATIIKTFDLSKTSKVGKYLHEHVFDKSITVSPISFNFGENAAVGFRGIDLLNGGFANKTEFISKDYIRNDLPEIFANELISSGFERHNIISANLINMEFMFDDHNAIDYNIYRYFGVYVDEHEEGKFEVNYISRDGLISVDPNTVVVNYNLEGTSLVPSDMIPTSADLSYPILSYVRSSNDYYHVTNSVSSLPTNRFKINFDKNPLFKGFKPTKNLIQALSTKPSSRGFVKLNITGIPTHNDRFFVGDKTEIELSGYNMYDYTCVADSSLPAGKISGNMFSNQGSLEQVAYAISKVIKLYKVYVYGTSIVIEDFSSGSSRKRMAVGILSNNVSDFLSVDAGNLNNIGLVDSIVPGFVAGTALTVFSDWNIWTTVGGAKDSASFLVEESELGDISIGEYVKSMNLNKFSRIIDVVRDHYDSTKYRVIIKDPVLISNDNTIQTYVESTPVFGKFHTYSLKDFDFDFYSTFNSDIGELKYEKFGDYQVSLDGASELTAGTSFNTGEHILQIWDIGIANQITVGDYLKGASPGTFVKIIKKDDAYGDTLIYTDGPLDPVEYNVSSSPSPLSIYTGVNFKTLTPILSKESTDDNNIDIVINSEYDRLYENSLKETSLKSRVVPTIMKFALKDATNARNNPYVLNVSEAFGEDNLSPNIAQEFGRNTERFNMEHFHINFIPNTFYSDNYITGLTSYLDFNNVDGNGTGISEQKLRSVDLDYFSLYFKWNGAYNNADGLQGWIDDKSSDLFTKFVGGSNELESSTVFRGLRYAYKKRKEFTKTAPTEFIETSEVSEYKFGVVLNYTTSESSNSITYKVIKNDVFKFICVYINLSVVNNKITQAGLTRMLLYDIEDITNTDGLIYNTKIPFNLDLSLTDWNNFSVDSKGNRYYSVFASQFATSNNTARFTEHINKPSNGNYSWIFFNDGGSGGGSNYAMKVVDVISDNEIAVQGLPVTFDVGAVPQFGGNPVPSGSSWSPSSLPPATSFYYWEGGKSGWSNILGEIVSYKFAKRFNEFGNIEYITVTSDGELANRYVLEIQDGVEFIKPSTLSTKADSDRPKSYKLTPGEIGRVITKREDGGYFTILRRMNGNYMPIFKDVVTFSNIYNNQSVHIPTPTSDVNVPQGSIREYLIFNKFRNLGISFESFKLIDQGYGYVKNAFFHKVNDENSKNLLKLSDTSDKLPLYPLISEIAIDKKNINVFKSKYSKDYFTKSLPAGKFELVHGTLTPVEIKSFMTSTIMKVKDTYDITRFESIKENSIDDLDSIRFNKLNTKGIHWVETDSEIIADFYLPKAIVNELREDKILESFSKYVSPQFSYADKTTILDDLEKYINSNIVNRFIIDSVNIYANKGKNITQGGFVAVTDPVDLTKNGFVLQTNFDIQGYQNDALSFRLIYTKSIGYGYNLKVHVKIQA